LALASLCPSCQCFKDAIGLEADQPPDLDEGDCLAACEVCNCTRATAYYLGQRGLVYQLSGGWFI